MKYLLSVATLCLILTVSTSHSFAAFIIHTPVSDSTSSPTAIKNDPLSITAALSEFKHLSRAERKSRVKDAKSAIKAFKDGTSNSGSTNQVLLIVLAIILPPLAVYLHEGVINGKFWLDLLLTLLFFLPGVIYALIVVLGKS